MRRFASVMAAMVVGTVFGAGLGFGVEQVVGQAGWALTLGAAGANAGAFLAAMRATEGRTIWGARTSRPVSTE